MSRGRGRGSPTAPRQYEGHHARTPGPSLALSAASSKSSRRSRTRRGTPGPTPAAAGDRTHGGSTSSVDGTEFVLFEPDGVDHSEFGGHRTGSHGVYGHAVDGRPPQIIGPRSRPRTAASEPFAVVARQRDARAQELRGHSLRAPHSVDSGAERVVYRIRWRRPDRPKSEAHVRSRPDVTRIDTDSAGTGTRDGSTRLLGSVRSESR